MVTIDGQNWATLPEAAKHNGVSYWAMQKWISRHKEVPTRRLGTAVLVRLEMVKGYEKRTPRSK